MMNVIAMWMLISSIGAAMLMSPEPLLVKTPNGEQHPLQAAKEATKESLHYAAEAARQTSEGLRRTMTSATQIPVKAAHTVQRKAGEAAQAIKDGSQLGLEKIGLAQPIESSSHFKLLEAGVQASKDKAATLKDATAEAAHDAEQGVEDAFKKYFGKEEVNPPTRYEVIKGKIVDAYDATKHATGETVHAAKDRAGQAAKTVKHKVVKTGDWIEDEAVATSKSAQGSASEVEEKVSNAAGLGREKAYESSEFVGDLASRIAQSVQDDIHTAKGKASETVEAAYENAAEVLKETATNAERFVGIEERPPTYQERIQQATEQAADVLKNRGKEAVSHLPNVGQGLAYGSPDTQEKRAVSDYVHKAGEWIGVGGMKEPEHGFKSTVGHYVEGVKKKLSGGPKPVKPGNWREEFFNKVGIYSEEDLSKQDIVIGNFNGYFSGGVFQKAGEVFHKGGEVLTSAVNATQDAAYTARDKASESMSTAGEAIQHSKDGAVDGVKRGAGAIVDSTIHHDTVDETAPGFYDKYKSLTQSGVDEVYYLKNRIANLSTKVSWITSAWLYSSFRTAHLFAFSAVYGTSLWVTFVSGYVLSRSIPRYQFGMVQSQVFPTYLKLVASGQALCLALYMILHPWPETDGAEKLQYLDLWGILMSTLANTFFLEPRQTKIMFEKMKVEKEEGRGQNGLTGVEDDEMKTRLAKINTSFHVLHGYSSLANFLGLLGMTWHLWHLSRRLVV